MYRLLERRDGRLDIAGREGALVLANDVGLMEAPSGCNSGSRVACAPLNGQLLKYTRSSTMRACLSRSAARAKASSMRPWSPSM
jgi:hypothetical protein